MTPRSVSRGRERTRSPPRSAHSRSPSRSPRRSISPRRSRSPSYHRNGDHRSGRNRSRSISRSPSPVPKSTKIVVEKLTKNINENHLKELFENFGEIVDMDMPMNRQFGTNRGTAYILYAVEADADQAIAHMHEAQLDGAVISVSVVIPRRKFSPAPPLARRGANFDPRTRMEPRGPPPARRRSPVRGYNRGDNREATTDTYRPRSLSRSRSRSPRAHRSRSRSYSSRSRSPQRRGRRDSAERNGTRKRSPSYSSYSSDRSRSRSRGKSGKGRR